MELKQIKELMTAMERAGIKKLSIKEKTGYEVHLERHDEHAHAPAPVTYAAAYAPQHFPLREAEAHMRSPAMASAAQRQSSPADEDHSREGVKEGKYVTSPMVGTFYSYQSPEDPSFVKIGDQVDENSVICIIEAMKVMNEVKAGMKGVVSEILVDNAHPVEFGTKMFHIRPLA